MLPCLEWKQWLADGGKGRTLLTECGCRGVTPTIQASLMSEMLAQVADILLIEVARFSHVKTRPWLAMSWLVSQQKRLRHLVGP
jgi:hypothetical protein